MARRHGLLRRCISADRLDARAFAGRRSARSRVGGPAARVAGRGWRVAGQASGRPVASERLARRARRHGWAWPRQSVTLALVRLAGVACVSLAAAVRGGRHPTAVPVGRLDAMGDQGARVVRVEGMGAVRQHRRLARRQRCALHRCGANVSGDRALVAGLVVARARPLRRCVDEPAVVVRRRRVRDCDLRRAAANRVWSARRTRWNLDRGFAAARRRACCPRGICRPADGRVLHAGRAGHAGVDSLAQPV